MQHEAVAVFTHQGVDDLLVLLGTKRGNNQSLGFTTREQGAAVRARQHAQANLDGAHGTRVAAVDAGLAGDLIRIVASLKIIISFAWMITISLNLTMGVAWHRFTAWANIWFKRESSGKPALGAVPPIMAARITPQVSSTVSTTCGRMRTRRCCSSAEPVTDQ